MPCSKSLDTKKLQPDSILILCSSLSISNHVLHTHAHIFSLLKLQMWEEIDMTLKIEEFLILILVIVTLTLGSGHMAHHHVSLIDLYLNTRGHILETFLSHLPKIFLGWAI